jgi:hypothetical protein
MSGQRRQVWMLTGIAAAAGGIIVALVMASHLPAPTTEAHGTADKDFTADVRRMADGAQSEAAAICLAFQHLKNAGDPKALDLLAPAPREPDGPVTEEEANRINLAVFLRQPIEIVAIKPHRKMANRFLLVTRGSVVGPVLTVLPSTAAANRTIGDPDIIVDVLDGKIHGVRAKLNKLD